MKVSCSIREIKSFKISSVSKWVKDRLQPSFRKRLIARTGTRQNGKSVHASATFIWWTHSSPYGLNSIMEISPPLQPSNALTFSLACSFCTFSLGEHYFSSINRLTGPFQIAFETFSPESAVLLTSSHAFGEHLHCKVNCAFVYHPTVIFIYR